jgi:maleylacetate reductase
MSNAAAPLQPGAFNITQHERIVFGVPAGEAVVAEADRIGAGRVFVTSTRSLAQKENGPLQRLVRALGARHAGTHATIRSHSPREDVVAGAA